MRAIILAAGYATRLYPLTQNQPKPLLPVGGRPMIEYILEKMEGLGKLNTIYIVTNAKFYDHFMRWKARYQSGKEIVIVNDNTVSNEDRLGAVGDIYYVIEKEKFSEDLLVIAGDNLFGFDLKQQYDYFKQQKASVVALCDLKDKSKVAGLFGVVELDSKNRIIGFEEKPLRPKTTLASTACYFLKDADLEELKLLMKTGQKPDNLGDFIRHLSARKPVYGWVFDDAWYDIGSHESYNAVNDIYKQKVIERKRGKKE